MDQFVCVRLVQANFIDLNLFQFDYDLTFAAFFLNPDRTVYGRFGSRSERKDATKEMTIEGFRKALAGALELHKEYPKNKSALVAKSGPTARFETPAEYPSLRGKYQRTLAYEGKVVQSCMHCHQVREAERLYFHEQKQPIPDQVLYPWPMPNLIGLALDPNEKALIKAVEKNSPAERAGFKSGDQILKFEKQPVLSIADVQFVLHNAPEPAKLTAEILRGNKKRNLTLRLGDDWRKVSDISWRVSTWDLRRMALGGLVLKEASIDERREKNLSPSDLALVVDYVGEYGAHAAGKKAGFRKDDIIVGADGRTQRMSESQFIGDFSQNKKIGERASLTVLRAGERLTFELPMQ